MDELTRKILEETIPNIIKDEKKVIEEQNALLKSQSLPVKTEQELEDDLQKEQASSRDDSKGDE